MFFFELQHIYRSLDVIDPDTIAEEAKYDGFYAVCTNLDDDHAVIAKINHNRWEIEESFHNFTVKNRNLHHGKLGLQFIPAHFILILFFVYRNIILYRSLCETFYQIKIKEFNGHWSFALYGSYICCSILCLSGPAYG